MKYYSPSTGGFYSEEINGTRKLQIVDPAFVHPVIEVENREYDPAESIDGPTIFIDDPDIDPPTIEIDNPDCTIPADAVEVPLDEYTRLIDGQADSGGIVVGSDGRPTLAPTPKLTAAQLATEARQLRDKYLTECDFIVIVSTERGVPVPEQWATYRQALRDIPKQKGFPTKIIWPIKP